MPLVILENFTMQTNMPFLSPTPRKVSSKVCLIGVAAANATVDKLPVFAIDKYGNLLAASNEVNT